MNTPRHMTALHGPGQQFESCQGMCPWDVSHFDKWKGTICCWTCPESDHKSAIKNPTKNKVTFT